MTVEILSTGTELLRGRNRDTHLGWLALQLEPAGLEVLHHQTVGDDLDRLVDALKLAAARSDVVLLTGGLGPTEDDYTRRAAAEAFHRPLEFRPRLWRQIRARFRKVGIPMASINRRQAYVPRGARALPNPHGSAPGFTLRQDGVFFAALPGPPHEMEPMFLRQVLPGLARRANFSLRELKSYGIPEGTVDEIARRRVGRHASYGITVRGGQVTLTLRAQGPRRKGVLDRLSGRLRRALGETCYEGDLEERVARDLIETRTTLAVAESCTGGLLAHRLTNVPGISEVLLEATVAYTDAAKVRRLGVSPRLLLDHGAVSEPVARAMARGAAQTSGADLGVGITGIAGPGGGSPNKPVGLCFIAVNDWVERKVFPGGRARIKEQAAAFALNMVRLWLSRTFKGRGKRTRRGRGPQEMALRRRG